jgi:hypothetical protein
LNNTANITNYNSICSTRNFYCQKLLQKMGGNALKTVQTIRKSPEDYEKIKAYVLRVLCEKLADKGIQWCVPYEAPGKDSFGDLDVLLTRQSEFDIREWILATFKPDEIVSNGGVYSFNIPGCEHELGVASDFMCECQHGQSAFTLARDFQIDFITTSPENFAVHHFFLSWGDCGMLVGQIAHAAGLRFGADSSASPNTNRYTVRFGQQGLFTSISDRPGMSDDLILSKDPRKICEFLGLDFDRWYNRFEEELEIFAWLCESPFMRKIKFDRTRRCREMYLRFGEFVKTQRVAEPADLPDVPSLDSVIPSLDSVIPSLDSVIPSLDAVVAYFGKQAELAEIQKKQSDAVRRSEKFGAHLFSALGDIKAWVWATDEDAIQHLVTEFLASSGLLPM